MHIYQACINEKGNKQVKMSLIVIINLMFYIHNNMFILINNKYNLFQSHTV